MKTMDINAKEWFDRINGNSYFSAIAIADYGTPDEKRVTLPIQYGYGSHYEYEALKALSDKLGLGYDGKKGCPSLWARDNGIIYRCSKQKNCRKREVVAFGIE